MEAHSAGPLGYIKLWRAALRHHLFRSPHVWHYFQFCLLKANWSDMPYKKDVNGVTVTAHFGEFISTIRNDAEDCGLTHQKVRTAQRRLEKERMLTRKPTRDCTIIKVTNFNRFQGDEKVTQHTKRHTGNTGVTHAQHTGQHILKNNKKKKKNKNINLNENKLSHSGQNYKDLLEKRAKELNGET